MQTTGPNSHADGSARARAHARREITCLACRFLSLCLCNVMRWQQLRTLLRQSNAGEDKLMKAETAAHPLMSRLVALEAVNAHPPHVTGGPRASEARTARRRRAD